MDSGEVSLGHLLERLRTCLYERPYLGQLRRRLLERYQTLDHGEYEQIIKELADLRELLDTCASDFAVLEQDAAVLSRHATRRDEVLGDGAIDTIEGIRRSGRNKSPSVLLEPAVRFVLRSERAGSRDGYSTLASMLRAAIRRFEPSAESGERLFARKLETAIGMLAQEERSDAATVIRDAIKIGSEPEVLTLSALSGLLCLSGDIARQDDESLEQARSDYRRAAEIDPKSARAAWRRAAVHVHLGELEAAERAAEETVSIAEHKPWGYLQLGNVALARRNRTAAETQFRRALARMDPKNLYRLREHRFIPELKSWFLTVASRYFLENGDPNEAIRTAREAVMRLPAGAAYAERAETYRALAVALRGDDGRDEDALDAERAFQISAREWLRNRNEDEAIADLEAAREINPTASPDHSRGGVSGRRAGG